MKSFKPTRGYLYKESLSPSPIKMLKRAKTVYNFPLSCHFNWGTELAVSKLGAIQFVKSKRMDFFKSSKAIYKSCGMFIGPSKMRLYISILKLRSSYQQPTNPPVTYFEVQLFLILSPITIQTHCPSIKTLNIHFLSQILVHILCSFYICYAIQFTFLRTCC